MSKGKTNLKIEADEESGKIRISISDEVRSRIPRVGDMMYVVQPYPADDDDEDSRGKVKETAIMAYSYDDQIVRTTALTEDADAVVVNGDFKFPLNEDMTIHTNKLMVFTREEDALDKYRSLMNASVEETERRIEKYENTKRYLNEALQKVHH